jgi:hypothetical protein
MSEQFASRLLRCASHPERLARSSRYPAKSNIFLSCMEDKVKSLTKFTRTRTKYVTENYHLRDNFATIITARTEVTLKIPIYFNQDIFKKN